MKRICIALLMAVFSFGILFAEGTSEKAPAEKTSGEKSVSSSSQGVRISVSALKGPSGIGMIKLFEENPSFGPGIQTDYQIAGSPDLLVSRILSGEVDIATLPTNIAAKLYNKGVPYYLGAVTGYGLLYLLSSDPGVKDFTDLKGKDLYDVGQGATPDFMVRYLIKKEGMDPGKDINIKFTYGHPELAQSLIAGRVQTGVLPEPFVTMVVAKNPQVHIAVDLQKLWSRYRPGEGSYPMTCVVVKKELLREHPEVVKAFLSSYKDSIQWVKDNPEAAGTLSEKHGIGMPAAVAAAAVPRLNLAFIPGPKAKGMMEEFLRVFLDFDSLSIGGKLPDEGFYTGKE